MAYSGNGMTPTGRILIAEILEAQADRLEKAEPKLGESISRSKDKNLVEANKLRERARLYREIHAGRYGNYQPLRSTGVFR